MARRRVFSVIVDEAVEAHFGAVDRKDRVMILDGLLLAHNPRFVQALEEAREHVRKSGGVPLAEFRRRLTERSGPVEDAPQDDA